MRRLSQEHLSLIASRAHALAEPGRVRMIEALSRGDQSVGQLASALRMQQSTASKHLQVLFRAGLVDRRRDASAVIYSVSASELIALCRYLGQRHLPHAPIAQRGGSRMDPSRLARPIRSAHQTRGHRP